MKKKVAVISAGVVLLLMFAGLGIWVLFRQSANEIEYAEDEIIIISRTVNFSEGYQDGGIFIDARGRVFSFSFTMANESIGTGPHLMEALEAIQNYCTPIYVYDEEVMTKLKKYSSRIDFTEEYETEHAAFDAGEKTLSVFDGSGMTVCRTEGDYEGEMKSRAAQRFLAYYDETMLQELTDAYEAMTQEECLRLRTYFYSGWMKNMRSIPTGYCSIDGMFVITSREDMEAYEALLQKEIFDWEQEEFHFEDYIPFEPEKYVYFIEQVNSSYGGQNVGKAGFAIQNGIFCFLSQVPDKTSGGDDPVTEVVNGWAVVAIVPREVAAWFTDPETGTFYYYPETGPWIRPQEYMTTE